MRRRKPIGGTHAQIIRETACEETERRPQHAPVGGDEQRVRRKSVEQRPCREANTEKNLVTASFEFPGVSKEDIQLDVTNGKLTVSAETKPSTEHSQGWYAVRELRFGKFSRTLQLPQGIKVS